MKRSIPIGFLYAAVLIATHSHSALANDLKIAQLEQDVREIKQQLYQQSRRIDSLESGLPRSKESTSGIQRSSPKEPEAPQLWLKAANWERVRQGMTELEVMEILGAPATLRPSQSGGRTLYYAIEMGAGSFLAGQVVIEGSKVVSVQKPALR